MPTHHLTTDLLDPDDPQQTWPERLSAAGLLAPVTDPPEDSPMADIARIQASLELLFEAQKMAKETHTIELPDVVWWVVGGALLFIILFAEAMVATLGPAAILGGLALAIGTALYTFYDRNRRRADAHVQLIERRLIAEIETLVGRQFVIRLGEGVLVSTPDLDALVLLADATAITDPDADITRRINTRIARLQERIEALIAKPGDWRRQNLSVDLAGFQQQLDDLPLPTVALPDD